MADVLQALRARTERREVRLVLPETDDPRVVAAREMITSQRLAEVVWVEDPTRDARFDEVAALIHERRSHKGVTPADARGMAAQPLIFGAGLCALGHADCGVSGAAHLTADVIRAGLVCIGTAPSTPLVSSMFLMVRGDEILSFADCGVLPSPSSEELVHVARTTATNHQLLSGHEPRVAFLSFSTHGSAEHADVAKMRSAAGAFRVAHPDVTADGELQFDAAYIPEVASRKCPESPLEGRANVLVFPDLDAGNIAYKLAQRLGGFRAYGPILQGFRAPWLDLSRGCTPDDVVGVAVIACAMTDAASRAV